MENPTSIDLYNKLLDISDPWEVVRVEQDKLNKQVLVSIEYNDHGEGLRCPVCGCVGKIHDHRLRRVRHLDTCDYQTILEVQVPRVECEEHKVQQLALSFAEKNSRYTMLFEAVVLDWLKRSPVSAVSESFGLGWDAIDGIMQRGIQRGLSRRKKTAPEAIGIDETSSHKGQVYVTIILDKDQDCVIDVLEDRKAETLENWFKTQQTCDLSGVKSVSMDMWDPYIKAVKACIAGAAQKTGFDRFHLSKHFNQALDKVRAREHRQRQKLTGTSPLSKSRFGWLTNSHRTDNRSSKRRSFLNLSRLDLVTARAWRIKEQASRLWDYLYMKVAEQAWKKLLWWISHCRIPEMIQVGKMVRHYFWGILNAIRLRITNSMLEAKNACIQRIKNMACGFRNKRRFKLAILFHLGNLDMRPATI